MASVTKPIIKWVGGKAKLLSQYQPFIPQEIDLYVEPFLGGGAMFFALQERFQGGTIAILSDANVDLINMYRSVRDKLGTVAGHLEDFSRLHHECPQGQGKEAFYYVIRDEFNADRGCPSQLQAARFIYLNKAGFNGLYRENAKGLMNVPKGKQKSVTICDRPALESVSIALNKPGVWLFHGDCHETIRSAKGSVNTLPNALFFVDPPYVPIVQKTNFSGYKGAGFSMDDQAELEAKLRSIADEGATVLTSNSIGAIDLYKDWDCHMIDVRRSVSRDAEGRKVIQECLFTRGL